MITTGKQLPNESQIRQEALSLGAELVGFAPASRWADQGDLPETFYPQSIWPLARTVIALGVPVWLPIVETSPSTLNLELYNTTNALLDHIAYRLAAYLNRRGAAAINISRDGYGHIDVLRERPAAVFSHVWAAHYGGIGRIGANRMLLTREYGPRVRLVSILTSLALPGSPMISEELCVRCGRCRKICPVQAFHPQAGSDLYLMNKSACADNSKRLRAAYRNPCGFCVKVCPVGNDRKLFGGRSWEEYQYDIKTHQGRDSPDPTYYKSWQHVRSFGGFPLSENTDIVKQV